MRYVSDWHAVYYVPLPVHLVDMQLLQHKLAQHCKGHMLKHYLCNRCRCHVHGYTHQPRMMLALCSSTSAPSSTLTTLTLTWGGQCWPSLAECGQPPTCLSGTWYHCPFHLVWQRAGQTAGSQCCHTTCSLTCMPRQVYSRPVYQQQIGHPALADAAFAALCCFVASRNGLISRAMVEFKLVYERSLLAIVRVMSAQQQTC